MRSIVLLLAAASCGRSAPSARARVLDQLPGTASAVFVADGAALAKFHEVVDVLRVRWPAELGCVVDAALSADEAGVATTRFGTSIVLVVEPTAKPACPALSKVGDDLWVASIGEGVFAGDHPSILDDPHWQRARAHLLDAPLAATLESARMHATVHASAQPAPLEAWVAFDVEPAHAAWLDAKVRGVLALLGTHATTSAIAARLVPSRQGAQIVVKLGGALDADLAAATRTVATWAWGQTVEPAPTGWTCPVPSGIVRGCATPGTLTVTSLRDVARAIAGAELATIVANGSVSCLRLDEDLAVFGLRRGDLVFACEGRPLENRDQLVQAILGGPHQASITVRRDEVDTKLLFTE